MPRASGYMDEICRQDCHAWNRKVAITKTCSNLSESCSSPFLVQKLVRDMSRTVKIGNARMDSEDIRGRLLKELLPIANLKSTYRNR